MKVFIDIGHPAHVHYFKNLIRRLHIHGHSIVVTARDKEMAHYLLSESGILYINRGKGGEGITDKAIYTIKADLQLYKLARKEKPDLILSSASPYCALVSSLMGKHHIVIDDKELPPELKPFELNIPKHRIHDVLAYASMFYGESATMASESAVLGVPAIYIDDQGRGVYR